MNLLFFTSDLVCWINGFCVTQFLPVIPRNNIPSIDKYLLLYSEGIDDKYKIYSTSIKTQVLDKYYIPLESIESIELIFDGTDYLVTNINKQQYVAYNAVNYLNLDSEYNSDYVVRDINEML